MTRNASSSALESSDRAARSLLTLMATVLLSCLGLCPAAEALPVAELTYRASDGLTPPEPLASWWNESTTEALTWWGEATGVPIDSRAALGNLHSLRLRVAGIPAADGMLIPTIAGWLREAHPVLTPSVLALPLLWPGFAAEAHDGIVSLTGPHGTLPQQQEPPPGLRVVVFGPGLAEELRQRLNASNPSAMVKQCDLPFYLAAMTRWQLQAGIDPSPQGPHGWLDTGLPAHWFKPVDTTVTAHLPDHTLAWIAFALNGKNIADDLQEKLTERGINTVWPISLVPLLTPAVVATLLDGTWLFAVTKTGFIARAPRSAFLDGVLVMAATAKGLTIPETGNAVVFEDHLLWSRSQDEWVFANSVKQIADWFALHPAHVVSTSSDVLVEVQVERSLSSRALEAPLFDEKMPIAVELPVPSRTWSRTHHAPGLNGASEDLGWTSMELELDGPGHHELLGRSVHDHLVLDMDGPLLPWLLPGMAIRWFADHAQDEQGKRHLRAVIEHRHASGSPISPHEVIAALPQIDPQHITAWKAMIAAARRLPVPQSAIADSKHLISSMVPWHAEAMERQQLEKVAPLIEATTMLDDPTIPDGGIMEIHVDAKMLNPAAINTDMDYLVVAMRMAMFGRRLVCYGDKRGLILVDRAIRLASSPQNTMESITEISIRRLRDQTWLLAIIAGIADTAKADNWLAEGLPPFIPISAWNGEAVFHIGKYAEYWLNQGVNASLEMPQSLPMDPEIEGLPRLALFQSHPYRADSAEVLAMSMEFADHYAHKDPLQMGGMDVFHSFLWNMFATFSPMIHLDVYKLDQASHVLIRLAARLQRLSAEGKLPRTPANAEAALGRLECPLGTLMIPLTYQRLADTSFRLFVSNKVPMSTDFSSAQWKLQVTSEHLPPGNRTIVPGDRLEVVIDPRALPNPSSGTSDF